MNNTTHEIHKASSMNDHAENDKGIFYQISANLIS